MAICSTFLSVVSEIFIENSVLPQDERPKILCVFSTKYSQFIIFDNRNNKVPQIEIIIKNEQEGKFPFIDILIDK